MEEMDKFLTEAMGKCWHEVKQWSEVKDHRATSAICSCGKFLQGNGELKLHIIKNNIPFLTWKGFGALWEWAIGQEWWDKFLDWYDTQSYSHFTLINPERFAKAIYNYLNEKETV